MSMKIIYKGTDISDSVAITQCVHDMYAAEKSDVLRIQINNESKKWDKWNPQREDEIQIIADDVDTGVMYVASLSYEDRILNMTAKSVPQSMLNPNTKTWEDITFKRIVKDIAQAHGLELKEYYVANHKYKYLNQKNESDASFLNRRCRLEGCAFLVFNKTLIVYNVAKLEAVSPLKDFDLKDNESFKLKTDMAYDSYKFQSGNITGFYSRGPGAACVSDINFFVASQSEANRFAKNLLRYENQMKSRGHKEIAGIEKGISAGTVINLKTDQAASWNDAAFVYRIRNDYIKNTSKIFFRKVLKGD